MGQRLRDRRKAELKFSSGMKLENAIFVLYNNYTISKIYYNFVVRVILFSTFTSCRKNVASHRIAYTLFTERS